MCVCVCVYAYNDATNHLQLVSALESELNSSFQTSMGNFASLRFFLSLVRGYASWATTGEILMCLGLCLEMNVFV